MTFEFNAKNIFLTYPRCDLSPADALPLIRALPVLAGRPFTHVIAQEQHADGSNHLHAVISLRRALHCRSERSFDLAREGGDDYHPNIQRPRCLSDVLEYTTKGGNYISDHPKVSQGGVSDWGTILTDSTSKSDFLERVAKRYPRDYVLSYSRLVEFADIKYRTEAPVYEPRYSEFAVPNELRQWTERNLGVSVS